MNAMIATIFVLSYITNLVAFSFALKTSTEFSVLMEASIKPSKWTIHKGTLRNPVLFEKFLQKKTPDFSEVFLA